MSHFCLDQSANAFWKPLILHTSYVSSCPAPQAGSSWEAGLRADARRVHGRPRAPPPRGRLPVGTAAPRGAGPRRRRQSERGMEGPAKLGPVALRLLAATRVLRTLRGRSRQAVGARGAGRRAGAPRRVWAPCPQPASPRPRSGRDDR